MLAWLYGSPKVASFQIETGAEKNAYFSQDPQTHSLQKMWQACFAAYTLRKLWYLPGQGSDRCSCQTYQKGA